MKSNKIEILRRMPVLMRHLIVRNYWNTNNLTVLEGLMEAANKVIVFLRKRGYIKHLANGRIMLSAKGISKQREYMEKSKEIFKKREAQFNSLLVLAEKEL